MRKILLGTTAVVGAALMGSGVAQAQQAPTVRVGGFMEFTGMYMQDTADRNTLPVYGTAGNVTSPPGPNSNTSLQRNNMSRDKFDFRHEFEIHVFVTGKAANGLSYGAVIELQNDNVGGGSGSTIDADEAWMFVSSPTLGTIRAGEEDSAASLLQVRVPTITGMGPDGNWDELLTNRNGTQNAFAYTLSGINDGSDASKVIYLSPQFFGFDFGVSWAPNSGEAERPFLGRTLDVFDFNGGAPNTATQRDRTNLTNEWSFGTRYRGSFGNIGVQAGFGMMFASAPSRSAGTGILENASTNRGTNPSATSLQDVSAYTLGLQVTGYGLTVGGEYTWGKYTGTSVGRAALANGRDDSWHYVLGATYVMGALSFGGYYGYSEQDNGLGRGAAMQTRRQQVWGVGTAYTLAPGMDLIASYNNAADKNAPADTLAPGQITRDVQVIQAGVRLAF